MSMKPLNPYAQEYRPISPEFQEEAQNSRIPAVEVVAIPSPKLVQLPHQLIPPPSAVEVVGLTHQKAFLGFPQYMVSWPHPLNHAHYSPLLFPIPSSPCVAEKNVKLGEKTKSPKSPPLNLKIKSGHRGRKFLLPPRQRGTVRLRRSIIINRDTEEKPRVVLKQDWKPVRKSSTTNTAPLSNQHTMKLTTVMVRNIPNQLWRDFMLNFLDHHCRTYSLEYDFMYLPMDFRKRNNLGYAFVNFTTAAAARKFMNILQEFEWGIVQTDRGTFTSKKICEITWAAMQGIAELVKRFEDSIFKCERLDYLPVVLDPPRNGLDPNPPAPIVLGTWQYRRPSLRR